MACSRSRTENLSEEAVGRERSRGLSAQGSVGSQAAPPLKGQGVREGTQGMCRRWCQLSVWAAESSEAQAGVQASQALLGAELRCGPRCLSLQFRAERTSKARRTWCLLPT